MKLLISFNRFSELYLSGDSTNLTKRHLIRVLEVCSNRSSDCLGRRVVSTPDSHSGSPEVKYID
jgi:hypothetical protein